MKINYRGFLVGLFDQTIYQTGFLVLYYLEQYIGLILLGIVVIFPILFQKITNRKLIVSTTVVLNFLFLFWLTFYQIVPIRFDLITIIMFPITQWIGLLIYKYFIS